MRTPLREALSGSGIATRMAGVLCLLLFWAALVGQASLPELAAGAAAAILSSYAWSLSARRSRVAFRPRLRWLAEAWRIPKAMLVGTWQIFSVLARQLLWRQPAPSLFLSVPFEVGGADPASAARRALAVAYNTVTPNFIVVGIDRQRGRLVYHQLQRGAVFKLTANLGARP